MSAKASSETPNPRAIALEALLRVLRDHQSLDRVLQVSEPALTDERDRGLCRALAYGVLRHHRRLAALRDHLMRSPLRQRDLDIALLIELGLFQLLEMEVPAHAAVSETVALTRRRDKRWARGLVNAVLRRFQRESATCLAAVDGHPAVTHSLPDWLATTIRQDWPDHWPDLAGQLNERGPMTLRVNPRQTRPAAMAKALQDEGIDARTLPDWPQALVLDRPVAVSRLPGFEAGQVTVQDGAAQLAAPLLAARDGDRVLDACAAPGGKTTHILELADVSLLALDSDAERLESVRQALARLSLTADLRAADAGAVNDWWDGKPFHRILLDAPCSGTGVIRRHPDIKWLRRRDDIPRLQARQTRLLERLWPLLAPGGRLVYATCSILQAENEAVLAAFMSAHPEATAVPPALPVGRSVGYGHQILTGESTVDGFYYACLEKR